MSRVITPAEYNMMKEINISLVKVPQVTIGFWVIKILATTMGETGGDAVTMSMSLGYALGTVIFMSICNDVIPSFVPATLKSISPR